jgi:hypothetical protein
MKAFTKLFFKLTQQKSKPATNGFLCFLSNEIHGWDLKSFKSEKGEAKHEWPSGSLIQ